MTTPFTDTRLNLEILAEECAEVVQIKSKIIRFGLDDFHPKNEVHNRQALEREIGHLQVMIDILVETGVISAAGVQAGKEHKLEKMALWYRSLPGLEHAPMILTGQGAPDKVCPCGCGRTAPEQQWPPNRPYVQSKP
jgi:hypothetical protein